MQQEIYVIGLDLGGTNSVFGIVDARGVNSLILAVCAIIVPLKMAYFAHKTRCAK